MNLDEIASEAAKVIIGALGGTAVGIWAEKKAAKSEAVKELLTLKTEYREFADYTKTQLNEVRVELTSSRKAEEDCRRKHDEAIRMVESQELRLQKLADLFADRMEDQGLPRPIKRPHRKDLL